MNYEPTLESVRAHVVPDWFHDSKLGIFVHWGLYSVPAWAPLRDLKDMQNLESWQHSPNAAWYLNAMRVEGSATAVHHAETYGEGFAYADFSPLFNKAAQAWDPVEWATLFQQAGARYVVLTAKYHDGFLLWPSEHPNPFLEGYQATRDLVGELAGAIRQAGMRIGLHYSSGLDWAYNPKVVHTYRDLPAAVPQGREYVAYADHHWRELIARYRPAMLRNDDAYPAAADLCDLFAFYYNHVPDGVISDGFDQDLSFTEETDGPAHQDFETREYDPFDGLVEHKWEALGMLSHSVGYNQLKGPGDRKSVKGLVFALVDSVSKNGNLLLEVGPMADGTIPERQRELLLGLGSWLAVNGEAIYGTRPWLAAEGRTAESRTKEGYNDVRFTCATRGDAPGGGGEALYVILLQRPEGLEVEQDGLIAAEGTTVTLLGQDEPLEWEQRDTALAVTLNEPLPDAPAYAFKVEPAPQGIESLLAPGPSGELLDLQSHLKAGLREAFSDPETRGAFGKQTRELVNAPETEIPEGFDRSQFADLAEGFANLTTELIRKWAEEREEKEDK